MATTKATTRKSRRQSFGNIRKLPSGRFQATYVVDGERLSLGTFPTKTEAQDRLAMVRRDRYLGEWRDPSAGEVALGQYVDEWIASSTNKAASTLDLYSRMSQTWINARLTPKGRAGCCAPGSVEARN